MRTSLAQQIAASRLYGFSFTVFRSTSKATVFRTTGMTPVLSPLIGACPSNAIVAGAREADALRGLAFVEPPSDVVAALRARRATAEPTESVALKCVGPVLHLRVTADDGIHAKAFVWLLVAEPSPGHLAGTVVATAMRVAIDIATDANAVLLECSRIHRTTRVGNTLAFIERWLAHLHAVHPLAHIAFADLRVSLSVCVSVGAGPLRCVPGLVARQQNDSVVVRQDSLLKKCYA